MEINNVLVLYASRHGATRQIAEQVWRTIRDTGLHTELRDADDDPNPGSFDAVVLGSAIYVGQWRSSAVTWLSRHAEALKDIPLWIFTSGPTGQGDPAELLKGETVPQKLEALIKLLKPREVRVFHGVLRPEEMNVLERMAIKMVKAPLGDFRDWKAIENWAAGIAANLNGVAFPTSETLPELQVKTAPAKAAVSVVEAN